MTSKSGNQPHTDEAPATLLADTHDQLSQQSIDEQAALWFTRQHSQQMSSQQRQAFKQWLADKDNQQAYQAIAEIWHSCEALPRPTIVPIEKGNLHSGAPLFTLQPHSV
ncbi:DUF4880 domain-containing protein [Proteus mirabilis]